MDFSKSSSHPSFEGLHVMVGRKSFVRQPQTRANRAFRYHVTRVRSIDLLQPKPEHNMGKTSFDYVITIRFNSLSA